MSSDKKTILSGALSPDKRFVVYDYDGQKLIVVLHGCTDTEDAERRLDALKKTARLLTKDEQ